jgi:hypothetical protein
VEEPITGPNVMTTISISIIFPHKFSPLHTTQKNAIPENPKLGCKSW